MTDSANNLHIEFFESALKCRVVWFLFNKSLEDVEYAYEVRNEDDVKVCAEKGLRNRHTYVETDPGVTYHIKVLCIESESRKKVAECVGSFRGIFSPEEMEQLYLRAVVHFSAWENKLKINYLYRCKPFLYFEEAKMEFDNTMVPYVKDNNGQSASPINGAINGLFFSARLMGGAIPNESPFGDMRFTVEAGKILDPEQVLLYFADFYCNTKSHYVTIVICRPGSPTNKFCCDHLPMLPKYNNPFIQITQTASGEYEFYANQKIWVELVFTENIPLSWGRLDKIRAKGMGTSVVGGLRHNRLCWSCNMYPDFMVPENSAEKQCDKRAEPY